MKLARRSGLGKFLLGLPYAGHAIYGMSSSGAGDEQIMELESLTEGVQVGE